MFWFPALPPELSLLNRPFLPEHLHPEIERVGVRHTVLVQGYPQTSGFNDWLFQQANSNAFIAGVVAWVDLERPEQLGDALDALQREAKFVGIRHAVESEPDADWIVRAPVLKALRELARRGIPFDMLPNPTRLENVAKVLDTVPELRIVLDHAGSPPIESGTIASWAKEIKAIGRHPQAWCKLSGPITQADSKRWRVDDLKPYTRHVLDIFGCDRVMFGSDWPVCLPAVNYERVWQTAAELLAELSDDEKRRILGGNAIQFYGLEV